MTKFVMLVEQASFFSEKDDIIMLRLPIQIEQSHPGHSKGRGYQVDIATVLSRLEDAGATLLSMPNRGPSTRLRQMRFDIVHTALEAYGWDAPPLRAPAPDALAISGMDEAFGWLRHIPDGNFVIRRIVGARALVHPLTRRHLFTWRRLGTVIGADHKSVQRWHGQGLQMIVIALNRHG